MRRFRSSLALLLSIILILSGITTAYAEGADVVENPPAVTAPASDPAPTSEPTPALAPQSEDAPEEESSEGSAEEESTEEGSSGQGTGAGSGQNSGVESGQDTPEAGSGAGSGEGSGEGTPGAGTPEGESPLEESSEEAETEAGETEPAPLPDLPDVTVIGTILYNDKDSTGFDWSKLIHPAEFDSDIVLTAYYHDGAGVEHTKSITTQMDSQRSDYYLRFVHDGKGGGKFTITNVPRVLEVGESAYVVDRYTVDVDNGDTMPYYTCPGENLILTDIDPESRDSLVVTLTQTVVTEPLSMEVRITPAGQQDSTVFTMKGTYERRLADDSVAASVTADYKLKGSSVDAADPIFVKVQVPVGMHYELAQVTPDGFRLNSYEILETVVPAPSQSGLTSPAPVTVPAAEGTARGIIRKDYATTVRAHDFYQNYKLTIDLTWLDNNDRAGRPQVTDDMLQLGFLYAEDPDGEPRWISAASAEGLEILGLDAAPALNAEEAETGIYTYAGLPTADENGQLIHYSIRVPGDYTDSSSKSLSAYLVEVSPVSAGGLTTVTLNKAAEFSVNLVWHDGGNADGTRPVTEEGDLTPEFLSTLHLYCDNGETYTPISSDRMTITKTAAGTWTVTAAGLPRYDSQNQELVYVLVEGTIDAAGQVTYEDPEGYQHRYYNGQGSFGNVTDRAYHGGTIYNRRMDTVEFTARKVWKDDGSSVRPATSTVTLWRYSVKDPAAAGAYDIDAHFNEAARVVFYEGDKQHLLSYTVPTTDSVITFDSTTVEGLPASYALPAYDELGYRYVYFVRETMGTDGNTYRTHYTRTIHTEDGEETETYANGTVSGGTIENIRTEKVKVTVNKTWICPSNTEDLQDVSVRVSLHAASTGDVQELPVLSEEAGSLEELTGDAKAEATTITGFTRNLISQGVTFYVNGYDEEGHPYQMADAVVEENSIVNAAGDEGFALNNDYYWWKGHLYHSATAYDAAAFVPAQGEKPAEHTYDTTNKITGTHPYTIHKSWSQLIPEEDVTLNFRISGYSEDPATAGAVVLTRNVTMPYPDELSDWSLPVEGLPAFDDNGYAMYYRAEETGVNGTVRDTEGEIVTFASMRRHHSYEENKTTVTNYITGGPANYYYVSKVWSDDGDTIHRYPVLAGVFRKQDIIENDYQLTGVSPVASMALTQDNLWYRELHFGHNGEDPDDYILLEYAMGDPHGGEDFFPVHYSAADLMAAMSADTWGGAAGVYEYDVAGGRVDTHSRSYVSSAHAKVTVTEVADAPGTYYYTCRATLGNIRVGEVDLVVDKEWLDGNDFENDRPQAIRVKLQKEGEDLSAEDLTELQTRWPQIGAEGILTLDATADDVIISQDGNRWTYTLAGLPKYDETGCLIHWSLSEEITCPELETAGYRSEYLGMTEEEKAGVVDGNVITASYRNRKEGFAGITIYKLWRDSGIGGDNRPDIYFTLYRYLRGADAAEEAYNLEHASAYTDYDDQIWTAREKVTDPGDAPAEYDWRIRIDRLPAYDESGTPYGYYLKETMNNNGVIAYGRYEAAYPSLVGETAFVGDGQTITNTIRDVMKVTGTKTWTQIPRGFLAEDLPSPMIILYRQVGSGIDVRSLTQEEIETYLASGDLKRICETTMTTNKYSYELPDLGGMTDEEILAKVADGYLVQERGAGGAPEYYLPKYAPDGRRYTYTVREQLETDLQELLYTKTNANGTLTNTFLVNVNRRDITVTKHWNRGDLPAAYDKYPAITMNLYRYIIPANPETAVDKTAECIDSFTFGAVAVKDVEENGLHLSHTFEDLLIYSPKGQLYGYYVDETTVDGYLTTYAEGTADGWHSAGIDITSDPGIVQGGVKHNDDAYIRNSYELPGSISIAGSKNWNDYSNSTLIYGARPDHISVRLYRYTKNQTGQVNAIDLQEVTLKTEADAAEPWIDWQTELDDPNVWRYTIRNLERYAPNGMAYVYRVSEEDVNGYVFGTPYVEQNTSQVNADGAITMPNLVNKLGSSYRVQKNWLDGNNKYHLRPAHVTMVLQRSLDGIAWEKIPWTDGVMTLGTYNAATGKWTGLPSADDEYVSIELNATHVVPYTKGNSWAYTFENLPAIDGEGRPWHYRAVETKIGNTEIAVDEHGVGRAGAYTRSYTQMNDDGTVVENDMDTTSLYVEKSWMGDQDDMYSSRPDKITFKLQKHAAESEAAALADPSGWMDVTDDAGAPLKYYLTAADGWKKVLEDLPVIDMTPVNDGSGETRYLYLYFRAVELSEEGTMVGAKNYVDTTDYTDSWHWSTTHSRNETVIENTMQKGTLKNIRAAKVWRNDSGAPAGDVTLELQVSRDGGETWESLASDETRKTISADAADPAVTWMDLPGLDPEGRELSYRVVELPADALADYQAEYSAQDTTVGEGDSSYIERDVTVTNIELQTYTVTKTWDSEDLAALKGADGKFSARVKLQWSSDGGSTWADVVREDAEQLLSTTNPQGTVTYTWTRLPMYTAAGDEIRYRAAETQVNGVAAADDTYYDKTAEYVDDAETRLTNTRIRGFVNLRKTAAYRDVDSEGNVTLREVTEGGSVRTLAGVIYDIYRGGSLWAANVPTAADGTLVHTDGHYGDEGRSLISGTYTIREKTTNSDYSITVPAGVNFTIQTSGTTAWIHTTTDGAAVTGSVTMLAAGAAAPQTAATDYINIEKRGTLSFTKTGTGSVLREPGTGETTAYFGVFTDQTCTRQVAGMEAAPTASHDRMILTAADADGNTLQEVNGDGVPYLRTTADGSVYLLSGTYYVKELAAPAGYIRDTGAHKAVIADSVTYEANVGTIEGLTGGNWVNAENAVKIYKRDQFGRTVDLGTTGALEIEVSQGTFPGGDTVLSLTTNPDNDRITYADGCWTLTGMFDGNSSTVYTLREPAASLPDGYLLAEEFSFTVDDTGVIHGAASLEKTSAAAALAADGSTIGNTWYGAVAANTIVLRDMARVYTGVRLTKKDASDPDTVIGDISFLLYRCAGTEQGAGDVSVLAQDVFLTTGADGVIDLSTSDTVNTITGKALKYGLTPGTYYFLEVERGASDRYRGSSDPIYFTISATGAVVATADAPGGTNYTWAGTDGTGIVLNEPVVTYPKTLTVTKKDRADQTLLSGASFTLTYRSVTDGDTGSMGTATWQCKTDSDGRLCLVDAAGAFLTDDAGARRRPDISGKGSYTLVETAAPNGYMTRTDSTGQPVTALRFTVDGENRIHIDASSVQTSLGDAAAVVTADDGSEDLGISMTVTNERIKVSLKKTVDTVGGTGLAGATLEIYRGTDVTDLTGRVAVITTTGGEDPVTGGVLEENRVYTLHEPAGSAPTGYLEAPDTTFILDGTITLADGTMASRILLTDAAGTPLGSQSRVTGGTLIVVDETIKAPVTWQKVRVSGTGSDAVSEPLAGALFDVYARTSATEMTLLGQAVTGSDGRPAWGTVTADGAAAGAAAGGEIILQQNDYGYLVEEVEAPANAWNSGDSYPVNITDDDYLAYRADPGYAVDLTASGKVENPAFAAAVTLRKYDGEHPQINAQHNNYDTIGISGATFTLYRGTVITEDAAIGTYTTGTAGLLTVPITEKGTYTLVETQAAPGYVCEHSGSAYTFRQSFTVTDADQGATLTAGGMADVANARIHGAMTLTKADGATGAALNGVEFTLYRDAAPATDGWFAKVQSFLTLLTGKKYTVVATASGEDAFALGTENADTAGKLVVEDLQWGTYRLVETRAADGYRRPTAEITFTVDATHLAHVITTDGTNFTNEKTSITLRKTTVGGESLAGASFSVYEVTTNTEGAETIAPTPAGFYTAADEAGGLRTSVTIGEATLYGLAAGTYVLRETAAPAGYALARDIRFTLSAEGVLTGNDSERVTFSGQTITVADRVLQMAVSKVDADDVSHRLTGAQFILTRVDGSPLADGSVQYTGFTCDNDGSDRIPVTLLEAGEEYRLTETTAPDGYVCSATATFILNAYGEVEVTGGEADAEDDRLIIRDTKVWMAVHKVDRRTGTGLVGVTFTLSPAAGSAFAGSAAGESAVTLTTGGSGFSALPEGILIEGNSYVLTETGLGDNTSYRQAESSLTFTVAAGGTLIFADGTDEDLYGMDATGKEILVKDPQLTLAVRKVDGEDGSILAGAVFRLTGLGGDDLTQVEVKEGMGLPAELNYQQTSITWKSGVQDASFMGLPAGSYLLEEIRPANDHMRPAQSLTFALHSDGSLTTAATGGIYTIESDRITVKNDRYHTTLNITKTGADGETLAGVSFLLERLADPAAGTAGAGSAPAGTAAGTAMGSAQAETVAEITTDDQGEVSFPDLENGRYRLTETKTVNGYSLLASPVTIRVDRQADPDPADTDPTDDPDVRISYEGSLDAAEMESLTVTGDAVHIGINNKRGFEFPATGTEQPKLPPEILILAGWIMAAVLLAYRKRCAGGES